MVDLAKLREAETTSRLQTSLQTSEGHFDQVVALSQFIINDAFAKIHKKNPNMNTIERSDRYATLQAKLKPSKLLIPNAFHGSQSQDAGSVIWQLNFESGTLRDKYDPNEKITLDNWVISTKVPLARQEIKLDDNDAADMQLYKKQKLEWLKKIFQVPGSYSPELLYAKLGSDRWNDFDDEHTICYENGQMYKYPIWKDKHPDLGTMLENFLKAWARDAEKQGTTTIGTKFVFKSKMPIRPVLFPPVDMVHQIYPWKIVNDGVVGYEKGVEGHGDPGSRNALLYCEIIAKNPLTQKLLPYSGNFTSLGSGPTASDRIEGTFALSRELFFESHLLPRLQALVKQSQIMPTNPRFEDFFAWTVTYFNYNIGNQDGHDTPEDDYYKFSIGQDKKSYVANPSAKVQVPMHRNQQTNMSSTFKSDGSPLVTATWIPGSTVVKIIGATDYTMDMTCDSSTVVDPKTGLLSPAEGWCYDKYEVRWNFDINIQAVDGELQLTAVMPPTIVTVENKNKPAHMIASIFPHQEEIIREDCETRMRETIHKLEELLNDGFRDQFKFFYPGDGVFSFRDPMFNNRGDLLTTILYANRPEEIIIIPDPKSAESLPNKTATVTSITWEAALPSARLEWSNVKTVIVPEVEERVAKPKTQAPTAAATQETPHDATATEKRGQLPLPEPSTKPTEASAEAADTPSVQPFQPEPLPVIISVTGNNGSTSPIHLSQIDLSFEAAESRSALLSNTSFKAPISAIELSDAPTFSVPRPSSTIDKLIGGLSTKPDLQAQPNLVLCADSPPGILELEPLAIDVKQISYGKGPGQRVKCVVTIKAQKGFITFPPHSKLTLTVQGVGGNAGEYSCYLCEGWCDEEGKKPEVGLTEFTSVFEIKVEN